MSRFNFKHIYIIPVIISLILVSCSQSKKVMKEKPRSNVYLPGVNKNNTTQEDSSKSDPQIITYTKEDGTLITFKEAIWDTINNESMTSITLEEVVVKSRSTQNTAERNGKILLDFIISVPKELQNPSWNLVIYPILSRGYVQFDTLSPLQLTGEKFRYEQDRAYKRYDKYLSQILTDSTEFFDNFVNKRGFYNYIRRREQTLLDLRHRYVQLDSINIDEDPIIDRFKFFNAKTRERFSNRFYAIPRNEIILTERKRENRKEVLSLFLSENSQGTFERQQTLRNISKLWENQDVKENDLQSRLPDTAGFHLKPTQYRSYQEKFSRFNKQEIHEYYRKRVVDFQNRYHKRTYDSLFHRPSYLREIEGKKAMDLAQISEEKNHLLYLIDSISQIDSIGIVRNFINERKYNKNLALDNNKDLEFQKRVKHPYLQDVRLDSIIQKAEDIEYYYTQEIDADENTSKLYLSLNGAISKSDGIFYNLPASDTLLYYVSSMTSFLDTTPRYVQRVVSRNAVANTKLYLQFPVGKSEILSNFGSNQAELDKLKKQMWGIMTDPIYIVDSIAITASSSPEGIVRTNEILSKNRAYAMANIFHQQYKVITDSLRVDHSGFIDESGKIVLMERKDDLPDLTNHIQVRWIAEDWKLLEKLIKTDESLRNRDQILVIIDKEKDYDRRETQIRQKYPSVYKELRESLYPQLRAVDIQFNLHRKGMLKDTIHTTEIDKNYEAGFALLKGRKYEDALEILRPYDDYNTAIAYMSIGYNEAALRILSNLKESAETKYLLAILYARKNKLEEAIQSFLRSCELNPRMRFRGNLDPEISELIQRFNLFDEF